MADNNSGSYTNMLRWRQEEPSGSKHAQRSLDETRSGSRWVTSQSRIERLEAEIARLREEVKLLRYVCRK